MFALRIVRDEMQLRYACQSGANGLSCADPGGARLVIGAVYPAARPVALDQCAHRLFARVARHVVDVADVLGPVGDGELVGIAIAIDLGYAVLPLLDDREWSLRGTIPLEVVLVPPKSVARTTSPALGRRRAAPGCSVRRSRSSAACSTNMP